MATLKDIKLRMGSVKNTQQITKAMKMVAASKMKRAEDKIRQARPYTDKLTGMVQNLSQGMDDGSHYLLQKRPEGKTVVLLITSDRGLCGGLNNNLCKNVDHFLKRKMKEVEEVELITLGKKGHEFFAKSDYSIGSFLKDEKEAVYESEIGKIVGDLVAAYEREEINQLYIAYNHFKNVITQDITVQQVLPIEAPEADVSAEDQAEFLLEPSMEEILDNILPQYVENQAYTAYLDNVSCEHASRMTSMDSATKNAGELLSKLTLQYNRARQAVITTELIEIISGAQSV